MAQPIEGQADKGQLTSEAPKTSLWAGTEDAASIFTQNVDGAAQNVLSGKAITLHMSSIKRIWAPKQSLLLFCSKSRTE